MVRRKPLIAIDELDRLSQARLEDAEALFQAGRYDAAVYLCGYGVELALKARICRTLGWDGYPETNIEFRDYRTYRTHDLNVLLHLSGIEAHLMANFRGEWDPYPIGTRNYATCPLAAPVSRSFND